jgi:isopentenyldiphosphate isomerase
MTLPMRCRWLAGPSLEKEAVWAPGPRGYAQAERDPRRVPVDELLDVLDADGRMVGRTTDRAVVHRDGLWHQTFHCWVVMNKTHVVMQLRSMHKSSFPGVFDISSAGHLAAGESAADGVRELAEELGVDVPFGDLVSVGTVKIISEAGSNREHAHVFIAHLEGSLEQFDFMDGEVDGLVAVELADFRALLGGETVDVTSARNTELRQMHRDRIVPFDDDYWSALLPHLTPTLPS